MPESARYRIAHRTAYQYSEPVAICQNQLRMMPRTISGAVSSVQCHFVETIIDPQPDVLIEHDDYFGNRVVAFAIESLHRELTVAVHSEVTVSQRDATNGGLSGSWTRLIEQIAGCEDKRWMEAQEYLFDSPRVRRRESFAEYARKSFKNDLTVLEASLDLTRRIHADFKYDVSATDVNTSTEEAFDGRAGVCQDFAHVQIACLRSLGVPARYVSGYLRTQPPPGKERLVGADESHAWVSVYAGDKLGWIDLDPTNACLSDTNHIPICVGRDYSEVSPMRGVVLGGGTTHLRVSVDVQPIDALAAASD